jgi:pyruvate/2-oxoglutarate dehydrogenase complex dihydrolipoamide acyltransferase (E2) component
MTLTLSTDHRVADGARAAQFLSDLVESIRQPKNWLS